MSKLMGLAPLLAVILVGMTALMAASGRVGPAGSRGQEPAEVCDATESSGGVVVQGPLPAQVVAEDGTEDGAAMASALQAFGADIDQRQAEELIDKDLSWQYGMTKAAGSALAGRYVSVGDITMSGLGGVQAFVSNGGLVIADIGRPVVVYCLSGGRVDFWDPSAGSYGSLAEEDFKSEWDGQRAVGML